MRVNLYSGCLTLVNKSGVGQAVLHQKKMLDYLGIRTTGRFFEPADAAHFNTVFPDSLAASLLARVQKKKVVYYGHSTMEDFRNSFKASNLLAPLFRRWIICCYNSGDVVITPTEYSKKILKGYGIKKPVYSLSNGVDTEFFVPAPERRAAFRNQYGLEPAEKAVISVGHYMVRKGILDFIELARKMPRAQFFWFGYTAPGLVTENVRAAMESAPKNLRFAGFVGQSDLRDAYCGCDLFAFLSTEETEGIVVLEALACRAPVLVRDIPVYDGWLDDGINVYKAKDVPAIVGKTGDILSGRLPDVTAAGQQVAQSRDIPSTSAKLRDIYMREHIFPEARPCLKTRH